MVNVVTKVHALDSITSEMFFVQKKKFPFNFFKVSTHTTHFLTNWCCSSLCCFVINIDLLISLALYPHMQGLPSYRFHMSVHFSLRNFICIFVFLCNSVLHSMKAVKEVCGGTTALLPLLMEAFSITPTSGKMSGSLS